MATSSELVEYPSIPKGWFEEISWIITACKGKGSKALSILHVYESWRFMNARCFGDTHNSTNITDSIIDTLVYRTLSNHNFRSYIITLMMP